MDELRTALLTSATVAAAVLAVGLYASGPAWAMGGTDDAATTDDASATGEGAADGSGTTEDGGAAGGTTEGPVITCPDGFEVVIDENTQEANCKQSSSGLIRELPAVGWSDADPAFVEAAVLAHSGAYEQAIEAFNALDRPDDPYVLNYLGFSNRKLGHTEEALAYYQKALAIRPDYVRVREYMGEGYVELGRFDEAREQLALIARECGTGCDEYRVLEASIAAALAEQAG